ncbi:MAG: endonuclease domain-containing protein [Burkholderiales bacterium]
MSDTSKALRKNQTDAESRLWQRLRNRQLEDCKFRRQHGFQPYIVDFVCLEKKLIVEVDGGQHMANSKSDEQRTKFLESQGFKVIRFWNKMSFKILMRS